MKKFFINTDLSPFIQILYNTKEDKKDSRMCHYHKNTGFSDVNWRFYKQNAPNNKFRPLAKILKNIQIQ